MLKKGDMQRLGRTRAESQYTLPSPTGVYQSVCLSIVLAGRGGFGSPESALAPSTALPFGCDSISTHPQVCHWVPGTSRTEKRTEGIKIQSQASFQRLAALLNCTNFKVKTSSVTQTLFKAPIVYLSELILLNHLSPAKVHG